MQKIPETQTSLEIILVPIRLKAEISLNKWVIQ